MPRKSKKPSNPLTLPLLALSLLVAGVGVYAYLRFRPVSPTEIFVIEPVPLASGPATLTGTVFKTSPIDEPGMYFLRLATGQVVSLVSTNLDLFVDQKVVVKGMLIVAEGDTTPPTMLDIVEINTQTFGE